MSNCRSRVFSRSDAISDAINPAMKVTTIKTSMFTNTCTTIHFKAVLRYIPSDNVQWKNPHVDAGWVTNQVRAHKLRVPQAGMLCVDWLFRVWGFEKLHQMNHDGKNGFWEKLLHHTE